MPDPSNFFCPFVSSIVLFSGGSRFFGLQKKYRCFMFHSRLLFVSIFHIHLSFPSRLWYFHSGASFIPLHCFILFLSFLTWETSDGFHDGGCTLEFIVFCFFIVCHPLARLCLHSFFSFYFFLRMVMWHGG